jgi:excisionase family DNA binding protein
MIGSSRSTAFRWSQWTRAGDEEVAMSNQSTNPNSGWVTEVLPERLSSRMSVHEIARRLDIGRLAVYAMLKQRIIPGVRLGRRWIITRHAYERWERTCGMRAGAGLSPQPEVTVN